MIEWKRGAGGTTAISRDGVPVASARPAAARGDMHVDINGENWLFYADRGHLVGERSGAAEPTLRAARPGRNRHTYDVRAEGADYRVERTSRLPRRFVVRKNGADIATGAGRGGRATLDLSASVPLEQEVFLLWLIAADHGSAKRLRSTSPIGAPLPGQAQYGTGGLDGGGMDAGVT